MFRIHVQKAPLNGDSFSITCLLPINFFSHICYMKVLLGRQIFGGHSHIVNRLVILDVYM